MAIRSMWSGYLGWGLVQVPVKLYKATESHDIGFSTFHDSCAHDGGAMGIRRYCKSCGEIPEQENILKGTSVEGTQVFVTKDELESLQDEAGKQVELLQFVDAGEIDPIYYESAYYVGAPNGAKAYALLKQSMEMSGLVALVRLTMRTKTSLAVLRPKDGILVLTTLAWADEIRTPEVPGIDADFTAAELTAAQMLVDSMRGTFEPAQHTDTYTMRLRELLETKVAGGEFHTAAAEQPPVDVDDLIATLEASAAAKKAPRKAVRKKPVAVA